jgi:hypothetical protein
MRTRSVLFTSLQREIPLHLKTLKMNHLYTTNTKNDFNKILRYGK